MKNFISGDDLITVPAFPYARLSGEGVKMGQLFGVATTDVGNGAEGVIKTRGVVELVKIGTQAWGFGALVYWDDTNKRCTTASTAGNLLIGTANIVVGAGAGETLGLVRLSGAPRANEP